MIVYPCLCTGADSTYGIDSSLGIDSSPGIDSTLESIPCDSDSGSFSIIPVMIPVPEKNGIITPLVSAVFDAFQIPVRILIKMASRRFSRKSFGLKNRLRFHFDSDTCLNYPFRAFS